MKPAMARSVGRGDRQIAYQSRRYSWVAIFLHWGIAVLIAWNLLVGFRMHAASGLAQFNLFQLHKSIGISVLLLSLLRLTWRLGHRPPRLPTSMRGWEHALARITHVGLYAIMIGLPLTGWAVVSTSPLNIPTLLFHTVPWPHLPLLHDLAPVARKHANDVFDASHVVLMWGSLALIALHVTGALKHALVERDGVLHSMLPFAARSSVEGRTS